MKIMMTDTVEVAHTIIPELEKEKIRDQNGLRVLSHVTGTAGGMTGEHYVLNLQKGSDLNLPVRLAKRLIKIGHAKAMWGN